MGACVLKSLSVFQMLSVVLKEIYIPSLQKLCMYFDRHGSSNAVSSVLDKEGDFAKPYGTITKGSLFCSVSIICCVPCGVVCV